MQGFQEPLLINMLGHAAGALLFAIFLVLLFSGRGWSGARGRFLSGLAAGLALAWNAGSLVALAWPGLSPVALEIVVDASFSALSVLPAVLLHLSVGESRRWLVIAGYVLSAVASAMHFREIAGAGEATHQAALMVITIGFLILTAAAVAGAALQPNQGRTRIVAAMCLALFAMSFVHFGAAHEGGPWSAELVVHHAGIPLALFVLLQDYRFILLDAFIRFLANAILAAVLTAVAVETAIRFHLIAGNAGQPAEEALLLVGLCLLLVLFAWLRGRLQALLTRAVFRQAGVRNLPERMRHGSASSNENEYLEWAAREMARAVKTEEFAVGDPVVPETSHAHLSSATLADTGIIRNWDWAEAVIPVRVGEGAAKLIVLGRRRGGQRYLGEDLEALALAATEVGERVESLHRQELNRLVSQAELRALQSQINPHFLFNALNVLYGSIPREAAAARKVTLNLADIFRYFLQSDKTFVPLSSEMQIVRAYLEVEQLRLGDRLRVEIDVDAEAEEVRIPVLSIQPLVENAIKHGVAPRTEPGYVRITAKIEAEGVRIAVENSSFGTNGSAPRPGAGVGLQNVSRRLEICYGSNSDLKMEQGPGRTTVEFRIPLPAAA